MKITILYASQTGYSEETAHRIQREAKQRHLKVDLKSMHEYNWASLPQEKLVVFVCSVTGQGDEPDTMTKFWKNLLRKSLAKESLAAMEFGVFGQGDSSYQKFNFPAKKLHKRLVQLGATPLVPRGDGDDQHYLGVDGALDPWLVQLWVEILKKYPIDKSLEIIPDTVLPDNIYSINILPLSQKVENKQQRGTYSAIVTKNNRITTTGHFQDVRHFEFKVNEADFTYNAGDSAVIYPKNRPEKIDLVLKYLGWHEIVDNYIEIIKNDDDEPGIYPLTSTCSIN
jgi:sulfite reductase alpha subunit-like flavoprotein